MQVKRRFIITENKNVFKFTRPHLCVFYHFSDTVVSLRVCAAETAPTLLTIALSLLFLYCFSLLSGIFPAILFSNSLPEHTFTVLVLVSYLLTIFLHMPQLISLNQSTFCSPNPHTPTHTYPQTHSKASHVKVACTYIRKYPWRNVRQLTQTSVPVCLVCVCPCIKSYIHHTHTDTHLWPSVCQRNVDGR